LTDPNKQLISSNDLNNMPDNYKQISVRIAKWRENMTERLKPRDPREIFVNKRDREHIIMEENAQKLNKPVQPLSTTLPNI
jgi:hypothetical protein